MMSIETLPQLNTPGQASVKHLVLIFLAFCFSCQSSEHPSLETSESKTSSEGVNQETNCDTIRPIPEAHLDSKETYHLHLEKPDETEAYHLGAGFHIQADGYWHDAEILIEEELDGREGYRLFKPFSYVREPNPSLGWPAWQAFDAIMVNVGWIPMDCANKDAAVAKSGSYSEAFDVIHGSISALNSDGMSSFMPSKILGDGHYDVHLLWDLVGHQIRNSDLPPCGINLLPICIDLQAQGIRP